METKNYFKCVVNFFDKNEHLDCYVLISSCHDFFKTYCVGEDTSISVLQAVKLSLSCDKSLSLPEVIWID